MPVASTIRALAHERAQPLRHRQYRRIAAAMLVTNMGNGMQFVANVWLVLTMTGSPRAVALVLLTAAIPGVIFGPVIGVAIDRFQRRWVYVSADLIAGTVLAVVLLLRLTGSLQTWQVFAMVFLLGMTESMAVPTGTTLVREIVSVRGLLAANATTGVAVQTGNVTGAAVGGILIAVTSVDAVLGANLASFVVSALFIAGVRTTRRTEKIGGDGWGPAVRRAAAGLTYLREHPKTVPSYSMLLVLFAVLYLLNTLLAPYALDVLDVGSEGLGLIDAMFALGAILGGIALPLLTARLNRDRLAGIGVIGLGLALVGLGGAGGLAVPMLLYAVSGVSFQAFYIFRTRVQEQVPVDLQGRVMALLITSVGLCRLVVYGLLAIFVSGVTLRSIYVGCGAAVALLGVVVTVRAFQRPFASEPPEDDELLEPVAVGHA